MNLETFLLFLAFIIFGCFSLFANLKAQRESGLKTLSYLCIIGSILADIYLLAKSFVWGG